MQVFKRIVIWLGIMAGLSLLAMGFWWVVWDYSQTTESLKWLQFMQTVGTFLLPPVLCAWMWDSAHRPFNRLHLNKRADGVSILIAVGIMVVAIPSINLMADLNSRVVLPDCLASLELWFQQQEATAEALTERFLQADDIGELLINLGLMALLPALAEELTFRGTLQQTLAESGQTAKRSAAAIWITAIVFSAIHMQFYGFVPRMLMGAMFGYVFVWSGNLWIPVIMHFTNNALAVLFYYLTDNLLQTANDSKNIADTLGAGDTWWLGVTSIVITSLGLLIFYRRTRTR